MSKIRGPWQRKRFVPDIDYKLVFEEGHPVRRFEDKIQKDPYIEVEKKPDFWVIRIMRPRKPAAHYPGFIAVSNGFYQRSCYDRDSVQRFFRKNRSKVMFHFQCGWDDIAHFISE